MFNLSRILSKENSHIAAIDLGSNSFHLIIARWENQQLTLLDRLREPVRMGWGLEKDGSLNPEVQERALACLERFGERLRNFPSGSVRTVGTKTLRSINNSREFLALAKQKLGHPVEIISGEEEARLIYLGVAHCIAPGDKTRLVMDIGGGSTEVIFGQGMEPRVKESLSMGCVAMTKRFFADGKVTEKAIKKARIAAGQEIAPVADSYSEHSWQEALGASGTIKAVASVCLQAGWSDGEITLKSLEKILKHYVKHGATDIPLAGVSEDRQPVFLGGAIVLTALFENLHIESMYAADWALREGLLFDLKGRLEDHDIREQSVQALARRFHVNMAKAERVAVMAQTLLHQVAESWALGISDADKLLRWAAYLYPVGLDIAHSDYHKHSAYIVENVDIAGCSRAEQAQLAALVRCHRKSLREKHFVDVGTELIPLAILLRLGHIFNRTKRHSLPEGLEVSVDGKCIELKVAHEWLEQNPLTMADLESEVGHLKNAGYTMIIPTEE
ncbi:exopolyphosphatase [Gilvimarinus sp. SDUM040013]|uniref:Exopolyphosphatase n=1 Tax=Gilvimarinus gilvus TaxID=3058038 RepID=A0ABU4RUM6_9GAMM|nr:exopolyphosphatase [Gilvimarinus sp. SDUM040013]MDO3388547.1 exopolyphosphatase [Gilvimarinus sp. SDUM040013]MDX6848581.1 exopolyphosphatase [Gilvimarinus sp. SDUM040013]